MSCIFQHVDVTAKPLIFYMRSHRTLPEICDLIHTHGGILKSKNPEDCFAHLVPSDVRVIHIRRPTPVHSVYIQHCVQVGRLLDVRRYCVLTKELRQDLRPPKRPLENDDSPRFLSLEDETFVVEFIVSKRLLNQIHQGSTWCQVRSSWPDVDDDAPHVHELQSYFTLDRFRQIFENALTTSSTPLWRLLSQQLPAVGGTGGSRSSGCLNATNNTATNSSYSLSPQSWEYISRMLPELDVGLPSISSRSTRSSVDEQLTENDALHAVGEHGSDLSHSIQPTTSAFTLSVSDDHKLVSLIDVDEDECEMKPLVNGTHASVQCKMSPAVPVTVCSSPVASGDASFRTARSMVSPERPPNSPQSNRSHWSDCIKTPKREALYADLMPGSPSYTEEESASSTQNEKESCMSSKPKRRCSTTDASHREVTSIVNMCISMPLRVDEGIIDDTSISTTQSRVPLPTTSTQMPGRVHGVTLFDYIDECVAKDSAEVVPETVVSSSPPDISVELSPSILKYLANAQHRPLPAVKKTQGKGPFVVEDSLEGVQGNECQQGVEKLPITVKESPGPGVPDTMMTSKGPGPVAPASLFSIEEMNAALMEVLQVWNGPGRPNSLPEFTLEDMQALLRAMNGSMEALIRCLMTGDIDASSMWTSAEDELLTGINAHNQSEVIQQLCKGKSTQSVLLRKFYYDDFLAWKKHQE